MAWGFTRGGLLWCDTCHGHVSVPCPVDHATLDWDEWCEECDWHPTNPDAGTVCCPECEGGDNDVDGYEDDDDGEDEEWLT